MSGGINIARQKGACISCLVLHLRPRQLGMLLLIVMLTGCSKGPHYSDEEIALAWAEQTLAVTKGTPGNSPTYASRCLGYLGVGMYESVVNGHPDRRSLAGQLSGLNQLPVPDKDEQYDWALVLSANQAALLQRLYNQSPDGIKEEVDRLEAQIEDQRRSQLPTMVADRSVAYGRLLARQIFEWSKSDGGHRAYLKNFDK